MRVGQQAAIVGAIAGCIVGAGCSPEPGGFARTDDAPLPEEAPPAPRIFDDATAASGVAFQSPLPDGPGLASMDWTTGGGLVAADLDGDGHLDLLVTAPHAPNRLFRGHGDGTFEPVDASGLEVGDRVSAGAAVDLDGDGLRDVLLGDAGQLRHLRNLGDLRFEELPPPLELPPEQRVVGISLADVDGDHRVDAWISTYTAAALDQPPTPSADVFLHGVPGGGFEDRSDRFGPADALVGLSYAAAWLDADQDGDLDLYVTRDKGSWFGTNALFLQDGGAWTEGASAWGLDLDIEGMGVAVGDVDGDGAPDLALSDSEDQLHVFSLDGEHTIDRRAGWGVDAPRAGQVDSWGLQLADLDNDGFDDLVVPHGRITAAEGGADQSTAFLRWDGARFRDWSGYLPDVPTAFGRTALAVDLDRDGGLELVIGCVFGAPSVFTAPPPEGAWVEVVLDGPPGNPEGLGARVTAEVGGSARTSWVTVGDRGLHSAQQAGARFGLGDAESASIEVRFADGTLRRVDDVPLNGVVTVAY